ncbi:HDOD domain-containing protein [Ideonella sp. 4Y11]|uniref:HDOD domain-containing protein n=1 Tax=Ideonella aquatica TaxID=2824119 RepID=A0A940YK75_9BURK|nr:HDOD domain-containing protein [Ideonella aquatica]MBQ0961655.1 HDOD domain-containing protein [Ideonella aquatica]
MPADTLSTAPLRHGMRQIQVELDQARDTGPLRTIIIPPCPALLQRLRDAMAQVDPDLTEVARIVGSDVAMSAALIRVANSPAYLTGQPVQTIGQAMNRLGLERTAAEMAAFLLQRSLPLQSPHLKRFWERAAKRANAMGFIARRLPGMSADLAHTYGLFCHVGTPVMLQSVKGYGSTIVEAGARIDRSYVATENANHRTDHAVVGALVARVWRLAPEVMAAIRRHHDLDMLGSEDTEPEVHTLVAAGLVAEHLMRRHEGLDPDADWSGHHGAALHWLAIDEDELAIWEDELRAVLDAA